MVSIIIPVLNEEKSIEKFLDSLFLMSGDFELLFVDGGSQDKTISLLKKYKMPLKIVQTTKGRANQMNEGSKIASGDILWFIHSDSIVDTTSVQKITQCIQEGYEAGVMTLFFYDSLLRNMKMVAFFSNIRSKFFHSFYGDQGIFITTSLFQTLNGFPMLALMEDYAFSKALKTYKTRVLSTKIGTSARRFLKNGIWNTIVLMQYIKFLYNRGVSADKLVLIYERGRNA